MRNFSSSPASPNSQLLAALLVAFASLAACSSGSPAATHPDAGATIPDAHSADTSKPDVTHDAALDRRASDAAKHHEASFDAAGDAGLDAPVNQCSAAVASLLGPIMQVSTGTVTILSTASGVRTVYVDASAGGFGNDTTNPRAYVNLETATRVDVTDTQASTSTAWDLAIKRPILFTNDGDGGPGKGGTLIVGKAFDQVTAADATGAFATESFVDASCNAKTDPTGAILTTFSNWYNYDQATNALTPVPDMTFVIRGGTGKLYKLAIVTYYAEPDGGTGTLGGYYVLNIGAL